MMYEIMKERLILMFISGCKFGEWLYFNYECNEKLTKREYSWIRKTKEFKTIVSQIEGK